MNSQIEVTIQSDWKQVDSFPIAIATLKITLPQLTLKEPLTKDQAEAFLKFNEELLGRKIKERIALLYPDLRTEVFCSGLKAGSLEYFLNIDVAMYVGAAISFIANYPNLKKGLKDIVSDLRTIDSWLTEACANTFDWITVGHPPPQGNKQQTSDEEYRKVFRRR